MEAIAEKISPLEKSLKNVSEEYDLPFGLPFLLPRSYDLSGRRVSASDIPILAPGTKILMSGSVGNFRIKHRGRLASIYADFIDSTGKCMLSWIVSSKAAYGKEKFLIDETEGKFLQVNGETAAFGDGADAFRFVGKVTLSPIDSSKGDVSSSSMLPSPIYPLRGSSKIHDVKNSIEYGLQHINTLSDNMPVSVEKRLLLPPLSESLQYVHGYNSVPPEHIRGFISMDSLWHKRVRTEMIWKTLFKLKKHSTKGVSSKMKFNRDEMKALEDTLPFTLTLSQKRSLKKIFEVFDGGVFKRILLQGDVGSGKTLVSIFSSLCVLSHKKQVAVIAPSTVLAQQLFEEYKQWLSPFDICVEAAFGKMTIAKKKALQKKIDSTEKLVLIGTTTVNSFSFKELGLLIVDEEQKLGVEAKAKLLSQPGKNIPYQILMSATPIPRSLASSIFGNIEVIKIESKPEGRLDVLTKIIRNKASADQLMEFIMKEINAGRKALVIAPSIESGEIASIESVQKMFFERFGAGIIGTIHGQMKDKEIEGVIDDYRKDKYHVIIATSMVEAGFSVPNISTVVITGPDRFGLSQLHQIRGRGGRSAGIQAYCALFPLDFTLSEKAYERLHFFSQNHDGFLLSAEDLKLRGSGELIGKGQSGGGDLNFIEHADEVQKLKQIIDENDF